MKRTVLLALAIALLLPSVSSAQRSLRRTSPWTGQVAAGYTIPAPDGIVDVLFDGGGTIVGGATYHVRRAPFLGFVFEASYNGYDVKQEVLDELTVSAGDLRIWGITSGVTFASRGKVGVYGTLGAGWYRRQIDLLEPNEPIIGIFCNPWWYFCSPVSLRVTQNVVGSVVEAGIGYNAGLGLTFRLKKKDRAIYVEAKYHYIPGEREPLEMLPVVVGYRW